MPVSLKTNLLILEVEAGVGALSAKLLRLNSASGLILSRHRGNTHTHKQTNLPPATALLARSGIELLLLATL